MQVKVSVRLLQGTRLLVSEVSAGWRGTFCCLSRCLQLHPSTLLVVGVLLQVIQTNVRGVFLCLKYQIPLMLETAGGQGAIVITSSTAGVHAG